MSKHRNKTILPTEVTATIASMSHDGRGIAHIDGKTTFIFGALPQENVSFRYTKRKSNYDEGVTVKINSPSLHRQPAQCPHFTVCGGCHLQHLSHQKQIEHKQNVFLELLQHQINTLPKQILPPISAHPWGYRHKARLSVKYVEKKAKVFIGFREKNSHLVTDIERCDVLHPSIGQCIPALQNLLLQMDARAFIPQIEIAIGGAKTALIFRHLVDLSQNDLALLQKFAEEHHFYLFLQPKGIDSIQLFYPQSNDILLSYSLPTYSLELQFHPAQFIQINQFVNERMITQALTLLELNASDQVLDLFCGIGNFTLPCAKYCAQVTGIEGDQKAIKQATYNAERNNLRNTLFYCADLFKNCDNELWAQKRYDKILLDPPRAGAKEVLQLVTQWEPSRILYISCNPTTLVRDTKFLTDHGYLAHTAGVMDMFPHTQHIEAMVLFIKP